MQSGSRLSFGTTRRLFLIFSPLLLLTAAMWAWHSYRFTSTALRTPGTIINLIVRQDQHLRHSGLLYCPVFRFRDQNGVEYTNDADLGSNPPSYRLGETVTVLYHPGQENRACIDSWTTFWAGPAILATIGVAFPPPG